MLFNSWGYILLFLIAGTSIHWMLPHRYRIYLLSIGGILFYCMWRWEFVLLMIFSPTLDYICALKVYKAKSLREKKFWLISTLSINIGLLVFFKYTYFIYGSAQYLGNIGGLHLPNIFINIILPLGISFYTFHSISYTIDVYRRIITPINSYTTFLTYVTFWPQLMAGPILRPKEVLPQLEDVRLFNSNRFAAGIERIIFGLFKKVVIADNLATMVDTAYSLDPHLLTSYDVWVAAFMFGFQIYFDFAGYSDIAIGSAKLLGVDFPENFDWPYLATSPKVFWKKWHISLSAWIRDYLYLPLTGQKFKTQSLGGIGEAAEKSQGHNVTIALFLTWFIMGLWHGAAWTFAIWGIIHASLIFVYRRFSFFDWLEKKAAVVSWLLVLIFSMLAWIPFRANSINQTFVMYCKLIQPVDYIFNMHKLTSKYYYTVVLLLSGMILLHLIKLLIVKHREHVLFQTIKYITIALLVVLITTFLENKNQFIYFQF